MSMSIPRPRDPDTEMHGHVDLKTAGRVGGSCLWRVEKERTAYC